MRGLRLAGSYYFDEVDTDSKVMAVVDGLTPDVLKKVWTKLHNYREYGMSTERLLGNLAWNMYN